MATGTCISRAVGHLQDVGVSWPSEYAKAVNLKLRHLEEGIRRSRGKTQKQKIKTRPSRDTAREDITSSQSQRTVEWILATTWA